MPKAKISIYRSTKNFLVSHPGQYFTTEALRRELDLGSGAQAVNISKPLAVLVKGKTSGIERRQNDEGRYEYGFTGAAQGRAPRRRSKSSEPRAARADSRVRKLADFIRAYLDLSPAERRVALDWLNDEAGR